MAAEWICERGFLEEEKEVSTGDCRYWGARMCYNMM